MNKHPDIQQVLDLWLTEGPNQVPDRVFDAAVDRIERQRQRPAWRIDWRNVLVNRTLRLAASVAAVLVIGIVGLSLLGRGPSIGGGPLPSPSPSPSPVALSSPARIRACDLLTPAEVQTTLGISANVLPDNNPGGGNDYVSYCVYNANRSGVLGLSYYTDKAASTFAGNQSNPGVQPVSGLGDSALWDPVQRTLYILKGSRLVSISADAPHATLPLATTIGTIIVGRM